MYICMSLCMYVCMFVCMYVCARIILCHCVFIIIYTLILAADWSISLLHTAENYRCLTVDKYLTSNCCPFAVRLLSNVSDDECLLSVCAQTVDRYIGTKRKRKINENQENNTLGECKQLLHEKSQTLVRYVGQQTDSKQVVRCFSAQTVAWADIHVYPFAVHLLSKTFC